MGAAALDINYRQGRKVLQRCVPFANLFGDGDIAHIDLVAEDVAGLPDEHILPDDGLAGQNWSISVTASLW